MPTGRVLSPRSHGHLLSGAVNMVARARTVPSPQHGKGEPACPVGLRMYVDFFGFRELPFNNTPDPRFFYSTPDHEEALASLIYAVKERKGFVLLTGEVGAGKTLVTRMMLRHFGTHLAFATINHAVQSPEDLMESICTEFELPVRSPTSATRLVRTFHDFLLAQFAQNVPVVLVLDEAQNLPLERFEQLRMIGNLEADDAKLLQVAIVGQPELQRMFLTPQLCQLRQRIFRSFHLPALSNEATKGYIRHRLSVVTDSQLDIFDKDAAEAVYAFSRGVPRVINTVCDNALLSAYSAGRREITGRFIESVIAQMMIVDSPQFVEASPVGNAPGRPPAPASISPVRRHIPPDTEPDRGDTTEQTPPAAEILLRQMEEISRRIGNIESQLRKQPPTTKVIERVHAPVERGDAAERTTAQFATLKRDVHSRVDKAAGRIAAIERRLGASLGNLAEARTIHASLKPLVERVRAIVGRGEAASQELERRDTQLRKLAVTIKDAIHDLRRLLDRAHQTAANTGYAERSARSIHERLVAQSERSCKLADRLARLVNRSLIVGSTLEGPRSKVECQRSLEADDSTFDIQHSTFDIRPSTRTADPNHIEQMLQSTRKSLSSLRNLARKADGGGGASTNGGVDLPTARLAHQVHNLLEMIEADGSVNG